MKLISLTAVSALLVSAALAVASVEVASSSPHPVLDQTFDIAMDGGTFSFEGETNAAGFPADGTPFIISGYIYPKGIFDLYGPLAGVNADGTAEFPDRVIGSYICRGWHVQDGDASTGPVVATTQIFDFGDSAGEHTIITDGIELADFGVPFARSITGSSGRLFDYDSKLTTCEQTYVGDGPNISGGFNARFRFGL